MYFFDNLLQYLLVCYDIASEWSNTSESKTSVPTPHVYLLDLRPYLCRTSKSSGLYILIPSLPTNLLDFILIKCRIQEIQHHYSSSRTYVYNMVLKLTLNLKGPI